LRRKRLSNIIIKTALVLILIWAVMLGTDYWRTTNQFKKPLFARCAIGMDDGGSGTYQGIGYSMNIKGNFMPEDEFPGVTHTQFMIWGNMVKEAVRD